MSGRSGAVRIHSVARCHPSRLLARSKRAAARGPRAVRSSTSVEQRPAHALQPGCVMNLCSSCTFVALVFGMVTATGCGADEAGNVQPSDLTEVQGVDPIDQTGCPGDTV